MTAPAQPIAASRTGARLAGWPIVGWATLAVVALCAASFAAYGGGEAGWRAAVRTSAKTSFAFFLAAFVASSARALWRNGATKWLLANRRYVGVSFAASHAVHLAAIVALASVAPDFETNAATVIGGGLAYVFLAAMTATSFDRSAAWLGPRWWKRLHKTGMYYNGAIFLNSYAPRMLMQSIWYAPFVVLLLGALALRFVVWRAQRRP